MVPAVNVRPFEWLFLWAQERPVFNATATLCTYGHPIVFYLGDPPPQMRLHVDVELEVFKRRGGRVSIYELANAEVNGQELTPDDFRGIEVEGGAPPVRTSITLARSQGPVQAAAGDEVVLRFRATHRRNPIRVTATIER